jgi:large repetitive protein
MTITPDLTNLPSWLHYTAATNTLTGTPPRDNTGLDTVIPVVVTDNHGASFASTVTVHPVNPAPLAVDQTISTIQGVPVTVDLLANDSDPDGDVISLSATAPPTVPAAQGSLALVGGNWVFTPAPAFVGQAVISYTVVDADGATATAKHFVDVAPNAPPALTDPSPAPGSPFIDPANPANLIVPAVDNAPVTIDLSQYYTDPNGDSMTITPDLTNLPSWLHYTAATNTLTGTPPRDNTGADTVIPVVVTDNHGASFASTVTVHPVNPGPDAVNDSSATSQGTPVTLGLLANDTDPDGDPLSIVGTPTLANPADGSLALVAGNWVFTPAPAFTGTATVTYTITDNDGGTDTATHTVTVAPLAAVNDDYTTAYLTPLNGDAALGDAFPSGSVFSVATGAAHGTITMNANGTYVYAPASNFAGTDTFTYKITDPAGHTVIATETIHITPPALAAVNDTFQTGYNTPVNGNAANADTFAAGSVFIKATPPAHGTVTMATNGTYVYTPATGFVGTDTFTYQVTDPTGHAVTAMETIIVSPPVLVVVDHTQTTTLNGPVNRTVATGGNFTPGSVFAVGAPPSHGTVVLAADGHYRYVPARGYSGTDTFTFTVTDRFGQTVTATETITVSPRQAVKVCLTSFHRFGGRLRR